MKFKTILTAVLLFASGLSVHAQSILRAGDSITWNFQLQFVSTEPINSPDQPFGGHVMLDYSFLPQAGSLDYRLDFMEDFSSLEPLISLPVHHLTGLHDQYGMPLVWVPEFSAPQSAWTDLNGVLRLTVVSGELSNVTPSISMLIPSSSTTMDYYQAVVVPEPGVLGLLVVGGLLIGHRRFRKL